MLTLRRLLPFSLLLLLGLPLSLVDAYPLTEDRIDTLQLKSVTKKRRHEITPLFSVTLNDPFLQVMAVGGSYNFHITDGFAFELMGMYSFTYTTPLVQMMRDGVAVGKPPSGDVLKLNPTFGRPQILAYGSLVWSPLVGKFAAGNSVFDVDMYLLAGAGYVRTNRENLFSTTFGIGLRFILQRWLVFRLEVRDNIYSQTLLGASVLNHTFFFNLGLGFMLPVDPIYTS